jgi:hypothetical protein
VEPASAHVTLDLDLDAEPIRGTFRLAQHDARRFEGWIELASLIDSAARAGEPSTGAIRDSSGGR